MRKLAMLLAALSVAESMSVRDHSLFSPVPRYVMPPVRRPPKQCGITRLKGPDYSDVPPVLARGKRRTRALKLAQVVNWHDENANLYGCHPCPKCGEVKLRSAIRYKSGSVIICGACGDKRPVHRWIS